MSPPEIGTSWHALVAEPTSQDLAAALEARKAALAASHHDGTQPEDFARLSRAARLKSLRDRLKAAGVTQDLSFVTEQLGMFSYSGLSAPQMQRLRSEFGVYGVDSGRICVAALNTGNIQAVAAAIKAVM